VGLADAGLEAMDVVEDGDSFEENAIIKAQAYAEASGLHALADDSGLCVDALEGQPGIHSARYGGVAPPEQRQLLLSELVHVPDGERTAHFECVIAVADPATGDCITAHGICDGSIAHTESDGVEGFGYDPIFIPDGLDRTFADIPKAEKNQYSHRGRAAAAILPKLKELAARQG
jgi:XTP/dITP diphosphohydrolase